jgi:hypothetical protein
MCKHFVYEIVEIIGGTMKTNKLSMIRWGIIVLASVGVLLAAGFIQMAAGAMAESQLQQGPLELDVAMVKQSMGTSCGEAVMAMVYNHTHSATPITEAEVIEYASANGFFTPDLLPYTSPANMMKIANYYADDVASGKVTNPWQGLSLLSENLREGSPVVIDVLSNFNDPESEAHFIVVTGLSIDQGRENTVIVHYNDPLTGTKETADWLGDNGVWNAWLTNNDPGGAGWWLVIAGP